MKTIPLNLGTFKINYMVKSRHPIKGLKNLNIWINIKLKPIKTNLHHKLIDFLAHLIGNHMNFQFDPLKLIPISGEDFYSKWDKYFKLS